MRFYFSSLIHSTLLFGVPLAEGRCRLVRPSLSDDAVANNNAPYPTRAGYSPVEDAAPDYASPPDVYSNDPSVSEGVDPALTDAAPVYPTISRSVSDIFTSSGTASSTDGNGIEPTLASTTSSTSSFSNGEEPTFTASSLSSLSSSGDNTGSSTSSSFGNGVEPTLTGTSSGSLTAPTIPVENNTVSSSSSFGNGVEPTLTGTSFSSISESVSENPNTPASSSSSGNGIEPTLTGTSQSDVVSPSPTSSSSVSETVPEVSTVSSTSFGTTTSFVSTTGGAVVNTDPVFASSTDNPTIATSSASVTTSSGVVLPVVTDQAYIDTLLRHHNIHRTNHSAPAMTWSSSLADTARVIAESCIYAHNTAAGGGGYGQNIGAGFLPTSMGQFVTDGLYNSEVNSYVYFGGEPDINTLGNWGHFSQITWVGSTLLGCYTNDCSAAGLSGAAGIPPYFTVCNYGPAGNVIGLFAGNVLPSIGLPSIDASFGCPSPVNCVNA